MRTTRSSTEIPLDRDPPGQRPPPLEQKPAPLDRDPSPWTETPPLGQRPLPLQWRIQDFPEEGAPTPQEGANIRFWQNFPKTAWNWKNLGWGARPLHPPLDQPLPWTETPWTETHLARDPPGQRPPSEQRSPLDEYPSLDRDPQTETLLWTGKHFWKHYFPATSFAGGKYWH